MTTAALLAAGCGGSDAPQSEADAVAKLLTDAAKAVADKDGGKACGYLTPDAQRQAVLSAGVAQAFGNLDCAALVDRATAFLTPLDRKQIESLEPSNVMVSGTSASATLAGGNTSVQLNLQKSGDDWKISGFSDAVGIPGG